MPLEISLRSPADLATLGLPADRPLRLLFLTSVRDVGDCDLNGSKVTMPEGPRYMEGVIERTVRETYPGGTLAGKFEVVGVITDDRPKDLHTYPVLPTANAPWLWPHDLRLPSSPLLVERTLNLPSAFRSLPRADTAGRAAAKHAFESEIYQLMQDTGADVLVSDHYMARIEHLISAEFGLYGRVINIHPAVTVSGHRWCFRGPTPTADAIARAACEPNVLTGATLHLVNSVIDDGPAIAFGVGTPVHANDQPPWLRWRNYQNAKLPLFVAGLQHYYRLATAQP